MDFWNYKKFSWLILKFVDLLYFVYLVCLSLHKGILLQYLLAFFNTIIRLWRFQYGICSCFEMGLAWI